MVFSAQVIPGIFQNSPTDDEPIELTNGYFYWKGDVITHNRHPPLSVVLQALPLRLQHPEDQLPPEVKNNQLRAYQFFFISNKDKFQQMTESGRWVSLLFGLGIGFLLFIQLRSAPIPAGLTALGLWAFHPTFLAYSGLCMADITVSFFFLASVSAFQKHIENPGPLWSIAAGGLTALAACSKFSALSLIPLFAILETFRFFTREKSASVPHGSALAKDWVWGAASFVIIVSLVYLPGTLLQPDHRLPFVYFLNGLTNLMDYSDYHHPVFFLGQCSRQNHWLYFPIAFLLKNTIPFTLFSLFAIWDGVRKKITYPAWLWVTPLFFLLCILPVQNLGVRYLLPAFPFLILMAAKMAGEWWDKTGRQEERARKLAIVGLLLWNVASILANEPGFIGYFNDLIPPGKKVYYLSDCDLDMGQDVKRLVETARRRGWAKIKLAQFGGAVDPSLYGLDAAPWTAKDLSGPQPGQVYAVNVTLFQTGPVFQPQLLPIARSWAATLPPTGRIGDAWIYFEVPGNPQPDPSPSIPSVWVF